VCGSREGKGEIGKPKQKRRTERGEKGKTWGIEIVTKRGIKNREGEWGEKEGK